MTQDEQRVFDTCMSAMAQYTTGSNPPVVRYYAESDNYGIHLHCHALTWTQLEVLSSVLNIQWVGTEIGDDCLSVYVRPKAKQD